MWCVERWHGWVRNKWNWQHSSAVRNTVACPCWRARSTGRSSAAVRTSIRGANTFPNMNTRNREVWRWCREERGAQGTPPRRPTLVVVRGIRLLQHGIHYLEQGPVAEGDVRGAILRRGRHRRLRSLRPDLRGGVLDEVEEDLHRTRRRDTWVSERDELWAPSAAWSWG